MKRINSLKGKKNFEEVYTGGRRVHQKEAQLIILSKNGKPENRDREESRPHSLLPGIKIGIPISRKFGNSVSRNRAKRRIRAICRELLADVKESYFIIIRPKEEFKYLSYEDARQIIKKLFTGAGVLRRE